LSEFERVLLDTATGANKPVWTSVTCKFCERQARYEVVIPDYRVRLDAVEKLLQQGLGRAREAQEAPVAQIPASAAAIERLSWRSLQQLAASFCVDELAAVQQRGSEALLRGRIAKLSGAERRVLREVLVETA
jgi:hypothetical protein